MLLSIVTPTYNRCKELSRCYESLLQMKNKDFEWLVIDDGSSDETDKYINSIENISPFKIKYYKKENGGKCSAINYSYSYIDGEYVLILDSDDYLSDDAVDIIKKYVDKYASWNDIAGVCFRKAYFNGKGIGDDYPEEESVHNYIDFVLNEKCATGERLEVLKAEWYKKYFYPEIEGEKFMGEIYAFLKIADANQNLVYVNKKFYFAEYLSNGLTKNIRQILLKNPRGRMIISRLIMTGLKRKVNFLVRLKEGIIYTCYAIEAKCKIKKIYQKLPFGLLNVLVIIMGSVFHLYLIIKYK